MSNVKPAHGNGDQGSVIAMSVEQAVMQYLRLMSDENVSDLYSLVLLQVEPALLRSVMTHVAQNQSKAAHLLGISRGTLRSKLRKHGLI